MRTLLVCLCFLLPQTAAAQTPVETYDLEEALHKAQRNSTGLQKAAQDITIAEARVKEAIYLFFPDVGLAATATRFNARRAFALRPEFGNQLLFPSADDNFYSGQAYATLSLYEGRRHINTLRLAKTALKQARSKFEAAKLDVRHRTTETFYRLILAQRTLEAVEDARGAAGLVSPAPVPASGLGPWERVEAEGLAAELRAAEAEARRELEEARLEFLRTLNRELDTPVRVTGELETRPVETDLRTALVWATELRPELQAQTYRAQMDAIGVNLALGRRIPSIVLGVDYEVVGQEFPLRQNNWDATVGVRLPFSLNFRTQHQQKVAEQRQGEIARAELRDQVHLEVRRAHRDLLHWQEEWPRRESEYMRVRALLDAAQGGSSRPLERLRAALRVFETRKRYLEAVAAHLLSRSRLERAVGRDLPEKS